MSVTAIIAILYMKNTGMEDPFLGPKGVRLWLLIRGVLGGIGVFMFYSGLHWLQLGDALSIWFTSPLLSISLPLALPKHPD
jgi:drug/metabolite transporter (DMT)-like permease